MSKLERKEINHIMLERLINIHKEIKSGSYPNTTTLAKKFNDGKTATISRDLEFLKDRFQAPIEYDYLKKGYYYTHNYEMPLNSISTKDVQSLIYAKQLLRNYKNTPLYKNTENVINLLADTTNKNINSDFLKRIAVPSAPQIQTDETIWNKICQALKSNNIIEFDYNGRWNKDITHRRVHPYQLLIDNGICYLFGYSTEREDTRLFCLSRMENLNITKDTFILPPDYDFNSKCGGGNFGAFSSETVEKYIISFYSDARQLLRECKWADDQTITEHNDDDKTTIEFSSSQYLKILQWILAQGMNAKPEKPDWFVEEWKHQIYGMLDRINK